MGTARVEIFRMGTKNNNFPGEVLEGPFQVAEESTSTTATTAGSRIVVAAVSNYQNLAARITHDELCYVAIGADPTAAAAALGWRTQVGVPLIVPVTAGQKISFKEVA